MENKSSAGPKRYLNHHPAFIIVKLKGNTVIIGILEIFIIFSTIYLKNSFSIFTALNPANLKNKKSNQPNPPAKRNASKTEKHVRPSNEAKSGVPGKPFFSKELLIKLLPLIKAFALWFLLVMIVHIPGIKEGFRNLFVGFTTSSTVIMAKILFIPIDRISFSAIAIDGFNMEIIVECTAYNFYLFALSLAVFANWSIRHKIINLLIFFGIIFLTNNLRFFAMGFVGRYYLELFDTTHDYVWNILFGFMIFGVWAWRDKVNNPDFKLKEPQP